MTFNITFKAEGRTGNNIFQYLTCKLIQIMFKNHNYKRLRDFNDTEYNILTDEIFIELTNSNDPTNEFKNFFNKNILCKGYFQNSKLFVKYRDEILKEIKNCNDIFDDNNCGERNISEFINKDFDIELDKNDIVISLRLDDFYQAPCPTSDIIPPEYYLNLLSNNNFKRLFIVCDKVKYNWELNYLKKFQKYNPIIINQSLELDSAFMMKSKRFFHSNSTLSWLCSYFSDKEQRVIPKTSFYKLQKLGVIEKDKDLLIYIQPLTHQQVLNL